MLLRIKTRIKTPLKDLRVWVPLSNTSTTAARIQAKVPLWANALPEVRPMYRNSRYIYIKYYEEDFYKGAVNGSLPCSLVLLFDFSTSRRAGPALRDIEIVDNSVIETLLDL